MYYRRKVLLALIEAFGGMLSLTDCQKLMFLFCVRTSQNIYDFFPYKYGACSFVMHQDKLRLTTLGYLTESECYQLTEPSTFFQQLNLFDQAEINHLVEDIGDLRGDNLLHKVYVEYPYFATQSVVAKTLLNKKEYQFVADAKRSEKMPRLFTIGYEGISIDAYLNKLGYNNIKSLVDVRKNPISKKYGFSKGQLKRYAENIGINYFHLPELGVPSNMRQDLTSSEAYQRLFQYYSTETLPHQTIALNQLRQLVEETGRIALTCFEAEHTSCHRSMISEYFAHDPNFNVPIVHL
jgi:uncharacterized protein (DUF488 family)